MAAFWVSVLRRSPEPYLTGFGQTEGGTTCLKKSSIKWSDFLQFYPPLSPLHISTALKTRLEESGLPFAAQRFKVQLQENLTFFSYFFIFREFRRVLHVQCC